MRPLAVLLICAGCSSDPHIPTSIRVPAGAGAVEVIPDPLVLRVLGAAGDEITVTTGDTLRIFVRDARESAEIFIDPELPPAGLIEASLGRAVAYAVVEGEHILTYDTELGTAEVGLATGGDFARVRVSSPVPAANALTALSLGLAPDEHLLGFGELFDGPGSRGKVRGMQFRLTNRITSGTNEVHGPVAFYVSSAGYGLFADNDRPGAFDVAATHPDRVVVKYQDDHLDLAFTVGEPMDVVKAYAREVGLPRRLPDWSLGLQQWQNELEIDAGGSGQDNLMADANTMRALGVPASVIWIDAPWETGYNTFAFNRTQFPDPEQMLADLDAMGFKVITWATNHLNTTDDSGQMMGMPPFAALPLHTQFAADGLLAQNTRGDPVTVPWGRGRGGIVDFSQADARARYQDVARPLVQMGIRGFKLDYGEDVRPELAGLVNSLFSLQGGPPIEWHNRYQREYHRTFRQLLDDVHGPDDGFLIVRSASHRDQSVGAVIWPGDLDNDFSAHGDPEGTQGAVGGLPASVSAAIALGASAFPYYAADTGGYRGGEPTGEVLARWIQTSTFAPVFQLGGAGDSHNPWDASLYPEPYVLPVFLTYARLFGDLFAYRRELVDRAASEGEPIIRHLGLSFHDDPMAWTTGDQFMFGDALLVAPVMRAGATDRSVYLPPGEWVDYWTGQVHAGGNTITAAAPLSAADHRVPLFMPAGSILPMVAGDIDTFADVAPASGVVSWQQRRLVRGRIVVGDVSRRLFDGTVVRVTGGASATLSYDGTGRSIWEVDLAAWGHPGGAVTASQAGAPLPAVPLSQLESCATACFHADGARWLYVSLAAGGSVDILP